MPPPDPLARVGEDVAGDERERGGLACWGRPKEGGACGHAGHGVLNARTPVNKSSPNLF